MDAPEAIEQGPAVVVARSEGGGLLLIDRQGNRSFLLDPAAGFRWEHSDGQCCVNQLIDLMRQEHEARQVKRHNASIERVLDQLVQCLPGAGSPPASSR